MDLWDMETSFNRWSEYLSHGSGYFHCCFDKIEDKRVICKFKSWFRGSVDLFIQLWSPTSDLVTASISAALIWVRILNLSLHLWNLQSLSSIRNALADFYCRSANTGNYYKTTYAQICMEIDFNKGFPTEINLTPQIMSGSKSLITTMFHSSVERAMKWGM